MDFSRSPQARSRGINDRDRILSVFSIIQKPDRILRIVRRAIASHLKKKGDDEIVDKEVTPKHHV
ncbi:MAG: hypothetical protein AB4290_13745 [Spirulina sp.]